jgi:hypothetical protein
MKIANLSANLIIFSIILLVENFINLIIFSNLIALSPFYLLLFIFSTFRFDNKNIFPIMGTGLLYDIFLSENYLGVYTIVYLFVAMSINYMNENFINFNFKLFTIFALNFIIYNIPNILGINIFPTIIISILINYLLFLFLKSVSRLSV